jgi:hypothetical protein
MWPDQQWYPANEDGEPVCPTCGTVACHVEVISESAVEVNDVRSVNEQAYRFYPCEHEASFGLPPDAGEH